MIKIKQTNYNTSIRKVIEHTIIIGKNRIWIDTSKLTPEDEGFIAIIMDEMVEGKSTEGLIESLVNVNGNWLNYTMTRTKTKKQAIKNHMKIVNGIKKEGKKFLEKYRGNVYKEGDLFFDVEELNNVWKNDNPN